MKTGKPNLPLGIGMILFSVTQIASRLASIPYILFYVLILPAIALELWGIILFAQSPGMKNSKLRQWKLRLIGRDQKE